MKVQAMKVVLVILSAAVVNSNLADAHAQSIYKCSGGEGIEYRDTPCMTGQEEESVSSATTPGANQSLHGKVATMPLSARELYVGMTDTQVLNLPGWGRPAHITRMKDTHSWRERWTYEHHGTGGDGRILYFENGLLAKHEDALPLASIEARATTE